MTQDLEQQANEFAATLLKPADDVRDQMASRPPTLSTIRELATGRYTTSLTATGLRVVHVCRKLPLALARVQENQVAAWTRTEDMRWTGFYLQEGQELPAHVLEHNPEGRKVESDLWLSEKNVRCWALGQSSVHKSYYVETQTLVLAEPSAQHWSARELEEPDPTPKRIPDFR